MKMKNNQESLVVNYSNNLKENSKEKIKVNIEKF